MIMGSLIDMGVEGFAIKQFLESILDVTVSISNVSKNSIYATDVRIIISPDEPTKNYFEIVDRIKTMGLPSTIEKDVLSVFKIMGEAESKVHGKPLDELHFHEVGQLDALADIIGCCMAIHELGIHAISCLPINVGGGRIMASHGKLPVPAPATLEMLRCSELFFYGDGERELLTPTGAALLSHFSNPVKTLPIGKVEKVGYGAGDADISHPNVLRLMLLEVDPLLSSDDIEVLETNIDDVTGEVLGNLFGKLMDAGAKDVSIIPATMKKGRVGHIIKVVTRSQDSADLAKMIMKETGSLGIRVIPVKHRFIADRETRVIDVEIEGRIFSVPVKVAFVPPRELLHLSAEYENCKSISDSTGIPVRDIIRKTEETGWDLFN
jgi:hypothetical protein